MTAIGHRTPLWRVVSLRSLQLSPRSGTLLAPMALWKMVLRRLQSTSHPLEFNTRLVSYVPVGGPANSTNSKTLNMQALPSWRASNTVRSPSTCGEQPIHSRSSPNGELGLRERDCVSGVSNRDAIALGIAMVPRLSVKFWSRSGSSLGHRLWVRTLPLRMNRW